MPEERVKIKIVVRGQGTAISDGATLNEVADAPPRPRLLPESKPGFSPWRIGGALLLLLLVAVALWRWYAGMNPSAVVPEPESVIVGGETDSLLSGQGPAPGPDATSDPPLLSQQRPQGDVAEVPDTAAAVVPGSDSIVTGESGAREPSSATTVSGDPGDIVSSPADDEPAPEPAAPARSADPPPILSSPVEAPVTRSAESGAGSAVVGFDDETAQIAVVEEVINPVSEAGAQTGSAEQQPPQLETGIEPGSAEAADASQASPPASRRDPFVEYVQRRNDDRDGEPVARPRVEDSAQVRRAGFASGMENREPVGRLDATLQLSELRRVFFFTELVGLSGQRVTHRWLRQGDVVASVEFRVGGDRWRVYSSKLIGPNTSGAWTVQVTDGAGEVLLERSLLIDQGS